MDSDLYATVEAVLCGLDIDDWLDWAHGLAPWPGSAWVGPIWWEMEIHREAG